ICQGAKEFAEFVDRLIVAVEGQVENKDAPKLLIKQLAFENSNADCKPVLTPLYSHPDISMSDILHAGQFVSTYSDEAQLPAAAVQSPNPNPGGTIGHHPVRQPFRDEDDGGGGGGGGTEE
ncbi:hypothetical protein JRQ81_005811, partial [Phrynocephalus forsythii]